MLTGSSAVADNSRDASTQSAELILNGHISTYLMYWRPS